MKMLGSGFHLNAVQKSSTRSLEWFNVNNSLSEQIKETISSASAFASYLPE